MNAFPSPAWPVLAVAGIQLVDGALCVRPVGPIARCFDDVRLPADAVVGEEGAGFRQVFHGLNPERITGAALGVGIARHALNQFAAAAGLLAGLRVPYLGALTGSALIAYFLGATGMHVRARDFGRTLFVNASGMLAVCVSTTVVCFVAGGERTHGR